jgi:hypothetical protein
LELALTEMAHQKLGTPDSSASKQFFEKHRMLGGLYQGVLKKLHTNLPSHEEMKAAVSEPRNNALHDGKSVSGAEASAAYEFVKKILVKYIPI